MQTKLTIGDVSDVEATLTITMTIDQWSKLRAQLPNTGPSWPLYNSICKLIMAMTQHWGDLTEKEL